MSRRPATITQADVSRALRAAGQCGWAAEVVILPGGAILIRPAGTTNASELPAAQRTEQVDEKIDLSF